MIAGSTPAILFSISALSLYFIERCRRNITPPFCQIRGVYHYPTLLPIYSRNSAGTIFSIFSNLPNNSFTSISLSSHRIVASLRCRCKGVYEVLTGEQDRALRFCKKSSLRPAATRYLLSKTLYVLTSTPKRPLKRNDRYDRKTHTKNVR